jgi:hypothetical protein
LPLQATVLSVFARSVQLGDEKAAAVGDGSSSSTSSFSADQVTERVGAAGDVVRAALSFW